jgi:hypothetical protein
MLIILIFPLYAFFNDHKKEIFDLNKNWKELKKLINAK